MKKILIVDDDIDSSLTYKKWLEDEGFDLTIINDPNLAEQKFKPQYYDLVLIGFKMSMREGFELYNKLREIEKKVKSDTIKQFHICFMTASSINYKALAEVYPDLGEECYVSKGVSKEIFINHVYSLMS